MERWQIALGFSIMWTSGIVFGCIVTTIIDRVKPVIKGVQPRVEVYKKKKKRYQKISA